MAALSSKRRKQLPDSAFALPGRRFPVDTKARARNALARGAQALKAGRLTKAQLQTIRKKVQRRFPEITVKTRKSSKR